MPLAGSNPNTSKSPGNPPEPTPHLNRPRARWSSCAMRWATTNGLWLGMHVTPVPKHMFSVIPSALAMNKSGAGIFSH